MKLESSRRRFLINGLGALAAATIAPVLTSSPAHAIFKPLVSPRTLLYPPMDLSYFDTPITAAASALHFGFTSMTWGSDERKAIDEIAGLGYEGIHLRATAVTNFQPSELRDLLAQKHLTFVALSSGEVSLDAPAKDEIAKHVANAKFVHDSGGLYIQILDQLKPWPRSVTPDECKRLGKLLTELGKRTADLGITVGYHNHINTISEHPENLDRVMGATDPRYVKLLLDTAHYLGGGGDPAKAVEKYKHRLALVHVKDVVDAPMGTERNQKYPFKFVELGQGKVNLPAFFAALNKVKFRGWAVVELDRVPDKSRTPKESATMCKTYIEERLKLSL